MKRKALLRVGEDFEVLEESEFAAETELQEALKRNPEVIPVSDLDLSEVVVVGRETSVQAGAIDLLLLDADREIIIVETKLARNPELRRQVVAQVLDYGASFWRRAPGLRQFEQLVLPYWRSDACEDERVKGASTLRDGLEPIFRDLRGDEWDYAAFEEALVGNLAGGRHVLLIVASGVTDSLLNDVVRYANLCLGLALYAVEIDVFETEGRQLIVPRGLRYGAKRPSTSTKPSTTPEAFLAACTPVAAKFFEHMLRQANQRGMIVYWGSLGFSVRMPLDPPVTVMYGYPEDDFQVYTAGWDLDDEGRAAFQETLAHEWQFSLSGRYTNKLPISQETVDSAYAALAFMWDEVERMMAADSASDVLG